MSIDLEIYSDRIIKDGITIEGEPQPQPEPEPEPEPEPNYYDYIIVGGGAGGILAAYKLAINNTSKNILVLENNDKTLTKHKWAQDDVN